MIGKLDEEKSLIQILLDEPDTRFDGREAYVSPEHDDPEKFVQDEFGEYYTNPHDHLEIEMQDGRPVGVLVADRDAKNCVVEHSYEEYPNLIGLYVREPYRGQGIATKLIDEFMKSTEQDVCVVHCDYDVVPFYVQLDWEIIYLQQIRDGNDPTIVPTTTIDISPTPKHNLPVVEYQSTAETEFRESCRENNVPAVYVCLDKRISKTRLPIEYTTSADDSLLEYTTNLDTPHAAEVVVDTTLMDKYLTEDACDTFYDLPGDCIDDYDSKRPWPVNRDDYPNSQLTWSMSPSDAKRLADELYSLVTDESNLSEESPWF